MSAIYVNGIKTSCMAIEGGGSVTLPTKFWQGNQTDYDNLSVYDDNTLYYVILPYNVRSSSSSDFNPTYRIYIGSNQVFPVKKDGYDYVLEDITFPDAGNNDYKIPTGINIINADNCERDWQLEFKAETGANPSISGDYVIIGGQRISSGLWEIYLNSSGDLYLFGHGVSDSRYCQGANNHDIKIIRDSGTLYVYKDDVLENTITGYYQKDEQTGNNKDYSWMVNFYSGNGQYRFPGTIHYLKFKWLD